MVYQSNQATTWQMYQTCLQDENSVSQMLTWDELNVLKTNMLKYCPECNGPKPPRSHHCRKCNRCIMRMDHHCPWVGSCIGIKNQKQFILFNFYTLIVCVYAIVILIYRGMICIITDTDETECKFANAMDRDMFKGKRLELGALVLVFIAAIFFGVFTLSMLSEQLYMVANGTSTIDRNVDRTQER